MRFLFVQFWYKVNLGYYFRLREGEIFVRCEEGVNWPFFDGHLNTFSTTVIEIYCCYNLIASEVF